MEDQKSFKIEDMVINLQPFCEAMNKLMAPIVLGVQNWINANQSNILNWIEIAKNMQKSMELVKASQQKMIDCGYQGGNYSLTISKLVDAMKLPINEIDEKVYQITISDEYINDFIQLSYNSPMIRKRAKLIEEGLHLHRDCRFAGSVTLIISQVEGIFNDVLISKNIASINDRGELHIDKEKLIGMQKKMEKVKEHEITESKLLDDLLNSAFIRNDILKGFNTVRNQILHGSETEFGTQKVSTQIVLWLYAIMIEFITDEIEQKNGLTNGEADSAVVS